MQRTSWALKRLRFWRYDSLSAVLGYSHLILWPAICSSNPISELGAIYQKHLHLYESQAYKRLLPGQSTVFDCLEVLD